MWTQKCNSVDMARDHRKLEAFNLADEMAVAVYIGTADSSVGEVRETQALWDQ